MKKGICTTPSKKAWLILIDAKLVKKTFFMVTILDLEPMHIVQTFVSKNYDSFRGNSVPATSGKCRTTVEACKKILKALLRGTETLKSCGKIIKNLMSAST